MLTVARTQFLLIARSPHLLATLVVIPLYSLVFFSVLANHHRPELATTVAFTAFLMSLWSHAVFVAAEAIDDDRLQGTLVLALLTPGRYAGALTVRIFTTTALALPVLAEVLLIGRWVFGFDMRTADTGLCAAIAVLITLGAAGGAITISGLMILVRGARTLQNALTYPFYLLGGLIVPVGTLPQPIPAVSRIFFLAQGAQLLRDVAAGSAGAVGGRLAGLLALVLLQSLLGMLLLRRVLASVRHGKVPLDG
ncbi:MAG: hypothetical protein JWN03_1006 [Nocardia sp.]|uniref:ABC transporter permease n=1 Tax=Nocardia sp. TaxID=1821 RepID=UPI002605E10B|nr:ABC transporter permease [Nocardia sp.]MCU1640731.1 hypothetical protein [Nocardia sp.]